jgi:mitochondrial fission protein ELM1
MSRTENDRSVVVIWRLLDGRPGHENQVRGLTSSLSQICPVKVCDVPVRRSHESIIRSWMVSLPKIAVLDSLPSPDLLIGAGHATHGPLLRLRRRYGGRSVVVMKPSLPTFLFDLCLIPRHDHLSFAHHNVIRTNGVLNRVQPSGNPDASRGLILVGGPSRHFRWSDDLVIQQITRILEKSSQSWTVATSDRTPDSFIRQWGYRLGQHPLMQPHQLSPDWLPEMLGQCGRVWVTCDSMSMIYEAITSGNCAGLIELPSVSESRISRNVQSLISSGLPSAMNPLIPAAEKTDLLPFLKRSEAHRCAEIVLDRLLNQHEEACHSAAFSGMLGRIRRGLSHSWNGLCMWGNSLREFASL